MKERLLLDFTDCRYVDQIWEITKNNLIFLIILVRILMRFGIV